MSAEDKIDAITNQIEALTLAAISEEFQTMFPQLEDEKIDAIADQVGALSLDEIYKELEGLFAQVDDEKIDAIADQVGALSVDEVYNAVEGLFAQLSAEDVDAIADQIGALSVDEIASAVEGLFAQTERISDSFKGWGESFKGWADETSKLYNDAAAGAKRAAKRTGDYFNKMYAWLAQLEDDKIDAIADQIGVLSVDEIASALEGLFAQLSAEDVDAIADQIGALSVDEVANAVEGLFALAQAEAEASDFFDWLGNVGDHVWDFVEDTAGHVAHALSGPAGKAIARAATKAFAQVKADIWSNGNEGLQRRYQTQLAWFWDLKTSIMNELRWL